MLWSFCCSRDYFPIESERHCYHISCKSPRKYVRTNMVFFSGSSPELLDKEEIIVIRINSIPSVRPTSKTSNNLYVRSKFSFASELGYLRTQSAAAWFNDYSAIDDNKINRRGMASAIRTTIRRTPPFHFTTPSSPTLTWVWLRHMHITLVKFMYQSVCRYVPWITPESVMISRLSGRIGDSNEFSQISVCC